MTIRKPYPSIHIIAAVSNISFNLLVRKMVNLVFTVLAYATEVLPGVDDYCLKYINAYREGLFGLLKN